MSWLPRLFLHESSSGRKELHGHARLIAHSSPMTPETPREAQLEERNAALLAQVEALKQELEQVRQDNVVLRLKVDAMARKLFGRSSEKLNAAQLQMVFEALQNEPLDANAAK